MLILLLLTTTLFQTIIGMDNEPNADATYEACANSCPRARNKVCPQRCKYYLKAGKKICWNCFCKICNIKFNNSFIHEIQHNVGEGSNSNWQQNVGTNWEEGQASSSQNNPEYYNNWDEDVNTISNQLEAINLREQNISIIHNQIQELKSNDENFYMAINQNIYKIGRNDYDDVQLFWIFNERILKHLIVLCDIYTSNNHFSSWTVVLCNKVDRMKILFRRISEIPPNIYFQFNIEFEHLAKVIRKPYYRKSSICRILIEERYNELKTEIISRIRVNQNWQENIKNLDDYGPDLN
ncbi:hypothetical protein Mgra_00003080 [Meloidogyne graminicola]|uniref:Uncharacterized protein n=1 Tax=Meloidogyne graminicola TaxID=189291 RepID=A0A8S9ZV33_9BILA|nr:hypothetical protein Mgra_00003080 [Meloidogyne graminicola]